MMYQIKQLPEDFIVKEISDLKVQDNGQYAYYLLKKTNYTTIDALQILSERFRIPLKNFGFGGNKDKHAVTEQKISVLGRRKNFGNVELKNIKLEYLGNGKIPISLGDFEGNEFIIVIRNLNNDHIKKIQKSENKKINVQNLYGPQRFSKNNHLIGKAIIKKDFKKAVDLITENEGNTEKRIKMYLQNNRNNYVEALRLIPLKTRKLFVHSYQSFLFNNVVDEYLNHNKNKLKNIKIPIIGFNFEIDEIKNDKIKKIIKKMLKDEKISSREFITSQIPELTSEGGFRDLFFELKFKILEIGKDELNENKQKIRINFTLPKSCYATVALESLFQ